MNIFKKLTVFAVILVLLLNTAVCFAYTDITEDNNAYHITNLLSSLNVLTGYDDGTFKPDANITRAEFSAIMCRALNLDKEAKSYISKTKFNDVDEKHWACGYINLCAELKIINGTDEHIFEPESNVTYEQAIKMIVIATGFEPMAASVGGWPDGYVKIAKKYEITKGLDFKDKQYKYDATRENIALLIYNALSLPFMEQTGFGTQTTYVIMDGNFGEYAYKSLYTGFNITKISGKVMGTANHKYNNLSCGSNEAIYCFNAAFNNEEWKNYLDKNADKSGYADYKFTVNNTLNIDKYLNTPSEIFIKKLSNGNYMIIDIRLIEEDKK